MGWSDFLGLGREQIGRSKRWIKMRSGRTWKRFYSRRVRREARRLLDDAPVRRVFRGYVA